MKNPLKRTEDGRVSSHSAGSSASDIFKFWSEVGPADRVHPRDRDVIDRIEHGFDLRCLPCCFGGPLKTAPVVLLYLSPGFAEDDLAEARSPKRRARMMEQRGGHAPLPGPGDNEPAWRWWSSRTKYFGIPLQTLQTNVAVLNIAAYHSSSFTHWNVLAALPSCRATLDWAHDVLFPQAEAGERVVVCMRAAAFWGLGRKERYGKALFAPQTTRNGFPIRSTREEIASRIRFRLRGAEQIAAPRERVPADSEESFMWRGPDLQLASGAPIGCEN